MPHLISTSPQRTAEAAGGIGIGVPGYAHPLLARAEWEELTRPGTPVHWVVLNVADGPGVRPDPHCLEAVGRLRNVGVRVLGHLDAMYGVRTFGELISDAHRYLDWYLVDGFFLDRCPTERAFLPEVLRTTTTLDALLGDQVRPEGPPWKGDGGREAGHLVLGHGTHPYPGYAEAADQLVTFAGSWADYRWSQAAEWTAAHPPERFCHLVHGVPRTHLKEAMRIARWQGASTVWFTDRTDRGGAHHAWEAMPGYWDEIVSYIGHGVSE
jgi:hypothetical protein